MRDNGTKKENEGKRKCRTVRLELETQHITHHKRSSEMSLSNPRITLAIDHEYDPSKHNVDARGKQCGRDEDKDSLDDVWTEDRDVIIFAEYAADKTDDFEDTTNKQGNEVPRSRSDELEGVEHCREAKESQKDGC